jgi:hypothetical protein
LENIAKIPIRPVHRVLCATFTRDREAAPTLDECILHEETLKTALRHDSMMDPIHARFEGGPLAWFRMHSSSLSLFGEGDFYVFSCTRATPSQQ